MTLTPVGGTLTAVSGVLPILAVADPTYVFNDAEDYPLGNTSSGSGKTADGSSRFDGFNKGTGATNEVASTHPVTGSRGFHFKTGTTAASAFLSWVSNVSHTVPEYFAAQMRIPTAIPAGNSMIIVGMRDVASDVLMVAAQLTSTGKFRLLGSGGTPLATTTAAYPIGSDFRLELALVAADPAAGHATLRYFADPFSATPTETLDVSAANTGSGAIGRDQVGLYNQIANCELYVDNVRKSNQGWPPIPVP